MVYFAIVILSIESSLIGIETTALLVATIFTPHTSQALQGIVISNSCGLIGYLVESIVKFTLQLSSCEKDCNWNLSGPTWMQAPTTTHYDVLSLTWGRRSAHTPPKCNGSHLPRLWALLITHGPRPGKYVGWSLKIFFYSYSGFLFIVITMMQVWKL